MKTGPKFTFTYAKSKDNSGYYGIVREVPGAASQGKTLEELKKNLNNAIKAIFEANRLEASAINQKTDIGEFELV